MNATDRAALVVEPVPVDAQGVPALACAIREQGQWRTAWLIGTRKDPFGEPYPTARAAAAAARFINERGAA